MGKDKEITVFRNMTFRGDSISAIAEEQAAYMKETGRTLGFERAVNRLLSRQYKQTQAKKDAGSKA